MPPSRLETFVRPALRNNSTACALRIPLWQCTTISSFAQFVRALCNLAQWNQFGAVDSGDLVFERFAHIDEEKLFAGVHFAFQILHVNARHSRRLRIGAAKLLVIDRLGDRRVFAANRAFRIAPQIEFAKFHFQRVEMQQPADQ